MTTLSDALTQASSYWEAKGPSSRMMPIRANACASLLGLGARLDKLGPQDGMKVLTGLRKAGKSKGSVASYYAAFKRMLELAGGVDTRLWPKADTPPRRCREPLSEADIERLAHEMEGYSARYETTPEAIATYGRIVVSGPDTDGIYVCRCGSWETYDLLELLRGTGLRVEREALNGEALRWDTGNKLLHVTGKGGHERMIPVERLQTVELLNSPARMTKMRRLSYSGHLKRWNLALERLKVESLKPTPHAVRHYYATKAYKASGHNLKLVQELLGHADIATTSRYLGVDLAEMRLAVA